MSIPSSFIGRLTHTKYNTKQYVPWTLDGVQTIAITCVSSLPEYPISWPLDLGDVAACVVGILHPLDDAVRACWY